MPHLSALLLLPALLASEGGKEQVDRLMAHITVQRELPAIPTGHTPFVTAETANPKVRQDPPKTVTPRVALQGIINKKALINDRLYGVGEPVGEYRLQSVTERGVTLIKNDRLYRISLAPGNGKIQLKRGR